MSHKTLLVGSLVLLAIGLSIAVVDAQRPPPGGRRSPAALAGTAFTYQGQLKNAGAPVNGTCNLQFGLWSDSGAGTQIGITQIVTSTLTNGLFTTTLNDGGQFNPVNGVAFTGDSRYLQIAVSCPSGGSYTALSPRQPLTATPYALSLVPGAVISGSLGNELTVNAIATQIGNPTALHGIAAGPANLFPAVPVAVWGESHTGIGVLAVSDFLNGVSGYSHSASGNGVYGSNDNGGTAVYGNATTGNGVYGTTANSSATVAAVYGVNTGGGYGVIGKSSNISVYASNLATSTVAYLGAPCCAADLYGPVNVSGNFNVSSGTKNFMMDDPLDPANKYLQHASVEAPDMINLYNGIALLDAHGEAIVQLPQWFGAINKDFRYQLTAVGAPMPNLYIAEEIKDNQFKIAGGGAGGKVSWQVTATRNDAWAAQHPFQAEKDKPAAERGTYLYPQGFGQPITNTVRQGRYGK